MLQEKNVNVLQKMLKLIQTYVQLFGITNLSYRELTLALLNLSAGPYSPIDDIIVLLLLKTSQIEEQELILKGMLDSMENLKDRNFHCILRSFAKFFKQKTDKALLQNKVFDECLTYLFDNSSNFDVPIFMEFFKTIG